MLLVIKEKFGLDVILPSTKFMPCQVTIRNSLKQSPNADTREMHNDTSNGMNLQFDNFNSTKELLKSGVISRGVQGGGAPLLKFLLIQGGRSPPTVFINLAIEHFSIFHNKLEKSCFKDLDVRCLSFVLSFTLN